MDLLTVIFMYINLGLEHIITGYDHLLFLLALIMMADRFPVVLKMITAFTVAHSITLCLAALGLIPVYPKWIEAGIALTICYVAVENIFNKSFRWRWLLTFGFGLIHGLGFANAIRDIGFHKSYLVTSLISFNVGIELGQLGVIALLLPILLALRKHTAYYQVLLKGISACIFIIGAYWMFQRLAG